jgi:uncharacterized DUF497 family protein
MLDFDKIAGFDWDAGNERKSALKHHVSRAEAESVFDHSRVLLREDEKHSQIEPRFHALGETVTGRLLHVTFTTRAGGTLIRVISARDMNAKERTVYAEET